MGTVPTFPTYSTQSGSLAGGTLVSVGVEEEEVMVVVVEEPVAEEEAAAVEEPVQERW